MRPDMKNPARNPRPKPAGKEFVSTDWGDVADWYDQHVGDTGGEYHRQVVIPGAVKLLAATAGEKVIDVACGQGVLCRILHSQGVAVTGVDAATQMIRAARQHGPAEINYLVGDARDLSEIDSAQFDAVACILAIQNIHPLPPVFQASARVLKNGGRLVIVMMHPCFRGPKETSWGWDESAKVQYRRIDRYLLPRKTPITTHPGSNPDQYTWTFHRPISAYVKALRQAGFLIDTLDEWPSHKQSTSGPRAAAENRAREEIPMFLAIRAIHDSGPVYGARLG
jgi:ubiquinone/menaquinone biosynthesis C-methylase UbiE